MTLLKNPTIKNLALTAISFICALMSLFAFNFGIIGNKLQAPISAKEWLFRFKEFHSFELSGFGTLLVAISFIISVGSILIFLVKFIFSPKSSYTNGMRLVALTSLLATLTLMIAGFIVSGAYANMMFPFADELKSTVSSDTYIPFLINLALTGAYFGADKVF
ncbi:MAG: hypothetical protein IKY62_04530 [Clostridia bacterium]|nr:hypothetical protein [Clostridia bacterium]